MTALLLRGCRSTPLGGYLAALGLLRTVARVIDPYAAGHWQSGRFVLTSRFASTDELIGELAARFEPEAIVSPWNAGSGFSGSGKSPVAERTLQQVRDSQDPRLARLAAAVAAGDRVVAGGLAKGWGGSGEELWDKARKADVLRLCRNSFPDDALDWLDAAVALVSDSDPTYSRLLGTGGNFGRQDLSVTYLQRALTVLNHPRGPSWLRAALTGDESVPYMRDAVGQFDPTRAGGIQSSPWEKADDKGFVNPWSFVLTLEGALLFAGAVVRRAGAQFSRPTFPFQVRASAAGFASSASAEAALGEIWLPEWSSPAGVAPVRHLLAEGRAEWHDAPAASGLDFARAISSLGVDRGIVAFGRHVIVGRLGQNPLAVPAGRVEVIERTDVSLLPELDPWLGRLFGENLPSALHTGRRHLEQRLFEHATGRCGLPDVIAALGRLVDVLGRSSQGRLAAPPLQLRRGDALLRELQRASRVDLELRLALAVATLQDPPARSDRRSVTLRPFLQPVAQVGRVWRWASEAAPAPLSGGLGPALAEVARRRAFPGAVRELMTDRDPGVRGVRITFARGLVPALRDRHAFVRGAFDPSRLAELLAGLLCVQWPALDGVGTGVAPEPSEPAIDLLLPFATADAEPLFVRPGADWPTLLIAGRARDVLADARRRLVIAGRRWVVNASAPTVDPFLLAASLLLRSSLPQRLGALDRTSRTTEESTHEQPSRDPRIPAPHPRQHIPADGLPGPWRSAVHELPGRRAYRFTARRVGAVDGEPAGGDRLGRSG